MRWLLVLLVAANVALYLHQITRVPTPVPESVVGQSALRDAGITLLAEGQPKARVDVVRPEESSCMLIGGFDEESAALAVEQRLLSLDIEAEVEPVDTAAGVDYWVYLPPLVSRQASLRQLRELQSRNIDSYIITVGELSNGISLGIFSRKDSAEGMVSRLQAIDYAAQLRELPRTHRRYWVRVDGGEQDLLGFPVITNLLQDYPLLEHRQIPCASVATSD